jgi:hypothetical protein
MGLKEKKEMQAKGIENILNEVITENFPNLEKEMAIQAQEAFMTQNKQDQNRNFPHHMTVKTLSINALACVGMLREPD